MLVFNEAISPSHFKLLNVCSMYGDIDLSDACSASLDPVITGSAWLEIHIQKGSNTNLVQSTECVTENNVYRMEIQADCGPGKVELTADSSIQFEN